jgi:hypothetical protein
MEIGALPGGARMNRILTLKPVWALLLFLVLDTICVGMGMGVPILCILFGFAVGWYIVRNITSKISRTGEVFRKVLLYAVITSSYTFIVMAFIWGRCISWFFNPTADYAHFGMPMILYEPKASFAGWLLLMIFVSPFLQLLSTVFGSYLALLPWMQSKSQSE